MFDPSARVILPYWNKVLRLDNTKSREVLGIQYHDNRETFRLMTESMIDNGIIKDKRKKK